MRIKKGTTRLEAAQEWINGFNAVPTLMIAKLWTADPDDWCEITRPAVGDHVRVLDNITTNGKITTINYEDNLCEIELDNGNLTWLNTDYINIEHDDVLPMWGTMWSFGDICDKYWLDDEIGLIMMSQCGFRIFKSEEFGYFFGIDGAGYDFYEQHWLPLYEKRGLMWHDPETDKKTKTS